MFIVGLKRMERARGSGWLDCPNCHEHALQDVVDAIRFAALWFYRFGPVERTRYLICRRCGFRREATQAELGSLETMGRPLRRAWFAPFGLLALLVIGALAYLGFASPSGAGSIPGITFVNINAGQLLPAALDVPQNWNTTFFTKADDQPPPRLEITTTSTGLEKIVLAKFTDSVSLADLVVSHFTDQTSIQSTLFPSVPPKATCTSVGGVKAAEVKVPFLNSGAKSEIIFFAFVHGGFGYTLTFVASGVDNITTMEKIATKTTSSFKFVASTSTASPGSASAAATPSAAATTSPSATAAASPSASPGAAAGASPSPAYTVSCS